MCVCVCGTDIKKLGVYKNMLHSIIHNKEKKKSISIEKSYFSF